MSFTSQCRCNNGAFAPHPAHDQELLSTVSAVQIACLLEEPKILGDLAEVSAYASRLRRWWKGLIQPMRLVVERIRIVTIKHTCFHFTPTIRINTEKCKHCFECNRSPICWHIHVFLPSQIRALQLPDGSFTPRSGSDVSQAWTRLKACTVFSRLCLGKCTKSSLRLDYFGLV